MNNPATATAGVNDHLANLGSKTALGCQHQGSLVPTSVANTAGWATHHNKLVKDLRPSGYVESLLVERLALTSWRLAEIVEQERQWISLRQEELDDDANPRRHDVYSPTGLLIFLKDHPAKIRKQEQDARNLAEQIEALHKHPDSKTIPEDTASQCLQLVAEATGLWHSEQGTKRLDNSLQAIELDGPEWTADALRKAIAVVAEAAGMTPDALVDAAKAQAKEGLEECERHLDALNKTQDQSRRARMLPKAKDLQTLARYEAHLEQSFNRTLHEFHRQRLLRHAVRAVSPQQIELEVVSVEKAHPLS